MVYIIDGVGCFFVFVIGVNLVKGYLLIEVVDLVKIYVYEVIVFGVQLNVVFGSVWYEGLLVGGVVDNDKKNQFICSNYCFNSGCVNGFYYFCFSNKWFCYIGGCRDLYCQFIFWFDWWFDSWSFKWWFN